MIHATSQARPHLSACYMLCKISFSFKRQQIACQQAIEFQVLYGISGSCSAYFPRLMKLGQQMCLCPDCRADGGGDGCPGLGTLQCRLLKLPNNPTGHFTSLHFVLSYYVNSYDSISPHQMTLYPMASQDHVTSRHIIAIISLLLVTSC